jgi:hypothetical protein
MRTFYLGTDITRNGAMQPEIRHQAHKAVRIPGCLNDRIWRNKYLNLETKVRIYKSAVRSVLKYSVETRAVALKKTFRNHRCEHFKEDSGKNKSRSCYQPGY